MKGEGEQGAGHRAFRENTPRSGKWDYWGKQQEGNIGQIQKCLTHIRKGETEKGRQDSHCLPYHDILERYEEEKS